MSEILPRQVAVCLKWVDLRPEVDPLSGSVVEDERWFGLSAADEAALEWALRLGPDPMAVTVGPSGAASVLRSALAAGAGRAVHLLSDGAPSSASTAAALASVLRGVSLVVCGDMSQDRGSGSVPAFLAHELGAAQALGLLSIEPGEPLRALRRLDGGRRERLEIQSPAVISVEGGTAMLRRASLDAVMRAEDRQIETSAVTLSDEGHAPVRPYRPRARALAAPTGSAFERLRNLTGSAVERPPARTVTVEPGDAADLILEQLRVWGYRQ